MLISTKNRNIIKSIALVLALVMTLAVCLTACTDKTARADVDSLKQTVDNLGKDVDTLEGGAANNVTNEALAEALAKYLETAKLNESVQALLDDYLKTADAETLVNGLLDSYAKKSDLEDFLQNAGNFLTKEQVETLLADYVKKTDLKAAISEYLQSEDATEILDKLSANSWAEATAKIYETIMLVEDASNNMIDSVYTAENWAKVIDIIDDVVENFDAANYDDLYNFTTKVMIAVLRAPSIEGLEEAVDVFKRIAEVETAADRVDDINKDIKELIAAKTTCTDPAHPFDGVTSKNGEAIVAIRTKIDAFLSVYSVEDDMATPPAYTNQSANLKAFDASNIPATNAEYGIDATFYDLENDYDDIVSAGMDADIAINAFIAEVGEVDSLTDAQVTKFNNDVKPLVEIALDENHQITEHISSYDTYVFYAWLVGKAEFTDKQHDAVVAVNAEATRLAGMFESAAMNAAIADIAAAANEGINALNYSDYKTAAEAEKALDAAVKKAFADMGECFYSYAFEQLKINYAGEITADVDANYTDVKYADIQEYADAVKEQILAVEVNPEEANSYTAASKKAETLKTNAIAKMAMMKAVIDAKANIEAWVADLISGIDTGLNKYDVVVNGINADKNAQFNEIDKIAETAGKTPADVTNYVLTAETAIVAGYYEDLVDIYAQEVQKQVYVDLNADKDHDKYADIYAEALKAIKAIANAKLGAVDLEGKTTIDDVKAEYNKAYNSAVADDDYTSAKEVVDAAYAAFQTAVAAIKAA